MKLRIIASVMHPVLNRVELQI